MIKKIITLAAGALLSFNATAGYVQYDLSGSVSGYLIQNDGNQSIVYYRLDLSIDGVGYPFRLGLAPQASEGGTWITYESTYFRQNGPTNFGIYSNFGGDQFTSFDIAFARGTAGSFEYNARYSSSIFFCGLKPNCGFSPFAGTHKGTAEKRTVNPKFATWLDLNGRYAEFVPQIIPTYIHPNNIPEPSSLALMAVGALGAVRTASRRKAAVRSC